MNSWWRNIENISALLYVQHILLFSKGAEVRAKINTTDDQYLKVLLYRRRKKSRKDLEQDIGDVPRPTITEASSEMDSVEAWPSNKPLLIL